MILYFVQSQLRNKLVSELKKSMGGSGPGMDLGSSESAHKSLSTRIADCIVAEYLNCMGYEYSLSIFLPEAGTNMDNVSLMYNMDNACSLSYDLPY